MKVGGKKLSMQAGKMVTPGQASRAMWDDLKWKVIVEAGFLRG